MLLVSRHRMTGFSSSLLFTGLLAFNLIYPAFPQATADFSGQWLFNPDKSNAGSGGPFLDAKTTLVITQTSDSILIDKKVIRPGSHDLITKEKYKLGGSTTLNPGQNQTKTISTHWSDDHLTLFLYIDWIFSGGGSEREFQGEDAYRLTDDGKTLTVFSTSQNTSGETRMVLVYDRVK